MTPKVFSSLLVLAGCSALAGACGGAAITKARAVAFADAVNVRNSDVPGMGRLVAGFETHNGPPFDSCTTRVPASDEVIGVESPWLVQSRGQRRVGAGVIVGRPPVEGMHTVVYVMRDAGIASRNVAAAQGAGVLDCVERLSAGYAAERLVGGEPYKRQIKTARLPFPLPSVSGYGLRVSSAVAAAVYHLKKRTAYYEDTFGFAVGQTEIVLHADGAGRPFSATLERRLLSLLYGRAKANALSS